MKNIVFFSYKGGAGRTSLLYNTLPFLAEDLGATPEEPIIVIDLDVDSKGLSFLVTESETIADRPNSIDVLKTNIDGVLTGPKSLPISEHPFFSKLIPMGRQIGLGYEKNGAVLFVTANATSDTNRWLADGNNRDARDVSLDEFDRICRRYNCKAIVMDAPAGDQLCGLKALELSDDVVTAMRITQQFRLGTYEFLNEKMKNYPGRKFVIAPNAIPADEFDNYSVRAILDGIKAEIQKLGAKYDDCQVNTSLIDDGRMGINEVSCFKIQEECLRARNGVYRADEQSALEQYQLLSKEICDDVI